MSLFRKFSNRLIANRQDYIDWLKIPREYSFVAIDAVDSRDSKGRVVFEAGRPVAYSSRPHFTEGRWAQRELPTARPLYVAESVIIGPLPKAADSLRIRPGRE